MLADIDGFYWQRSNSLNITGIHISVVSRISSLSFACEVDSMHVKLSCRSVLALAPEGPRVFRLASLLNPVAKDSPQMNDPWLLSALRASSRH